MMISLDVLETLKKKGKISEKTFNELKKIYDLKKPQKMAMGGIAALTGVGEESLDPAYAENYVEAPKPAMAIIEEGKKQAASPTTMELEPTQQPNVLEQPQGLPVGQAIDSYAREAAATMDNTAKAIGYAQAVDKTIQKEQEKMALLNQEKDNFFNQKMGDFDNKVNEYQNSKIDPNRFWANKSTADKLLIGIGLAMSGANGSNQGTQLLMKAIDDDINAQKAEIDTKKDALGAKRTYLRDMMDVFKDKATAIEAAKLAGLTSAEAKLKEYQVRAQGALQKAELNKMAYEIGTQKAMIQQKLSSAVGNSGPARDNAEIINKITQIDDTDIKKVALKEFKTFSELQDAPDIVKAAFSPATGGNFDWRIPATKEYTALNTIEAKIFPIVKAIADERMTEGDARAMVQTWIPEKDDLPAQVLAKQNEAIGWIRDNISKNTKTLQALNIIPKQRFQEQAPVKGK